MSIAGQVITGQQFTIVALASDSTTGAGNTGFREIVSNWDSSNSTTSVFLGTTGYNPTAVRFTDQIGGAADPLHNQTGVGSIPNPIQPVRPVRGEQQFGRAGLSKFGSVL